MRNWPTFDLLIWSSGLALLVEGAVDCDNRPGRTPGRWVTGTKAWAKAQGALNSRQALDSIVAA
jgi:hypothetical protein